MASFLEESSAFSSAFSQLAGKSVLVLGHRRPDGDCIGSQVALTRVLLSRGIDARAVNADPVPRTLRKFVGDTPFFRPDEVGDDDFVTVTVDCADHKRVGNELAARFPNIFLNVDHHVSNDGYAEVKDVSNYVLETNGGYGAVRELCDRIHKLSIK